MAEFFKHKMSPLSMNVGFNGENAVSAAKNGPGNVATPKASTMVGPTGDKVAHSMAPNTSFLSKATSTVGATGDKAAK